MSEKKVQVSVQLSGALKNLAPVDREEIKSAVSESKFVQNVQVVSVNNECKELLFECKKNTSTDYSIMCVNISSNNIQKFSFNYSEEKNTTTSIGLPQQYLYDPNSSITKAGAFRIIAARFNLKKISTNTHLYTSDKPQYDKDRVLELVEAIGFSNARLNYESSDFGWKIAAYADMRVKPHGVASMKERLTDGRVRFNIQKPGQKDRVFFEEMAGYLEKIEDQIFSHMTLKPEDITEEMVQKVISGLDV